MQYLRIILISLLILTWEMCMGQSNAGRDFYIAAPPNDIGDPFGKMGYVGIYICGDSGISGTIDLTNGQLSSSFTISGLGYCMLQLPLTWEIPDDGAEHPTALAIYIQADSDVEVFLLSHRMLSSDIALCLPVNALDTDYVVAAYYNYPLSEKPKLSASQFVVVAAEDSTLVTIAPSATTRVTKQSAPFSIMLQRGQVYLVQGISDSSTQDFTGTHIHASKHIAVLSGHGCTSIPLPPKTFSHDCLLEQLPPVAQLDTVALCVPFGGRVNGDLFRIISAAETTRVFIGGTLRATLPPYSFVEIDTTSSFDVRTSQPVLVMQYMKTTDVPLSLWDPSMSLIVPPSKWMKSYRYVHPVDTAFRIQYATVIIPDSAKQSLQADGVSIAGPFYPIGSTSFVYAYILQSQGMHEISADVPVGVMFYGAGYADSYAAPAGAAYSVPNGLHVDAFTFGFDTLHVGTCRDTFIVITNTGTEDIHISSLRTVSGVSTGFAIVTTLPITLKPRTSANIVVRFCPPLRGTYTEQLEVESDARERPVVTLAGRGVQRFLTTVSAEIIHGKVGDTLAVPLHLLTPIDSANAQTVSLSMQYNTTVLYPISVLAGEISQGFVFDVSRNDSGCILTGTGSTPLQGAGILATVMMEVLLGDSMSTALTLFDPTVKDSDVTIQVVDGLVVIDSLCGGSGNLLDVHGNNMLESIYPNPISSDAVIAYSVSGNVTHLGLYNMLGEEVQTFVDSYLPANRYSAVIHKATLPAGIYTIRLQSGRYEAIKRVVIVR